jgi:optic atrophy 3 protein
MRVSVASMRDVAAEKRAKEKAEAPTVKTAEQVKAEEDKAAKAAKTGTAATKEKVVSYDASKSVWSRKFRPIPEAKAVDLFADVLGDAFVLLVAGGLITYEYIKAKSKPDQNSEKIAELAEMLKDEERRVAELEEIEKKQQHRVDVLEQALEFLKKERASGKLKTA